MSNIIIPADANDYALIDTFNRAGFLEASAATYAKFGTGLWAETNLGEFLPDTAGYVTRKAASPGPNEIAGMQVFAGPKKVAFNVFGGTNSRCRIHLRKTSENVDRANALMNSIEVKTNNNGSNGINSTISIITGGVISVALADENHGSGLDARFDYRVLIEDTGTEIKITIGGVTRTLTLVDPTVFESNDFIGINMRDSTEELSQLRAW